MRYGVSPQPPQAPENSNNGCCSCCWPILCRLSSARGTSVSCRKKSQLPRACSRNGRCGAMLIALRLGSLRSRAGHTSTHRAQPVQSSAATWMVKVWPAKAGSRAGAVRKPSGAAAKRSGAPTLARITAWGHTSTHLPHCTHRSVSHTGTASAMLRFSQRAVPTGQVPSQGRALTGRASPRRSSIGPITSRTKSGAPLSRSSRNGSGPEPSRLVQSRGTRCSRLASRAARFIATTASPLRR